VWCEVTSSIRTRSPDEESAADVESSSISSPKVATNSGDSGSDETPPAPAVKELLLCLRPIRDGEKKVDESLRFVSAFQQEMNTDETSASSLSPGPDTGVSSVEAKDQDNYASTSASNDHSGSSNGTPFKRPLKKRPPPPKDAEESGSDEPATPTKRRRGVNHNDTTASGQADDTEKSMLPSHQSLMQMNK
jgi:hypothetical protein